jgi:hypothetical protein
MADLRPLLDSYPLYIDGRWVDPASGRDDDISPAWTKASTSSRRSSRTSPLTQLSLCIPGDAPFGGFKQSGLGREGGGLPGLHQYMEPKAIGTPA